MLSPFPGSLDLSAEGAVLLPSLVDTKRLVLPCEGLAGGELDSWVALGSSEGGQGWGKTDRRSSAPCSSLTQRLLELVSLGYRQ
jgi:hypothetical protein